jgi:hypothetical protein
MTSYRRGKRYVWFIVVFIFYGVSVAFAILPTTINYQGYLTDSHSSPVPNGSYDMRFYLFDAETGGNQLWNIPSGEQQSVSVNGGIYNVQLGAVEPLDSTIFVDGEIWLEIAIYRPSTTSWETLSPRQKITSTAFAFKAGDADTLESKTVSQILDNVAGDGIRVSAIRYGVCVSSAENDGVMIVSAGGNGMRVYHADLDGVYVEQASEDGVHVNSAGEKGVFVQSADHTGVYVGNAGYDGVFVYEAGDDGVYVGNSGGTGMRVSRAGSPSAHHLSGLKNGFEVGGAETDGLRVGHADRYGVHVNSAGNKAGYFNGDVVITGNLSKGSGSFTIDHPLDPQNKYLNHSFVESPDMMNVYNGNVVLDSQGEAWVALPEYFESLNKNFRYQLTCIGGFAQVYVAEEIHGNSFMIAGGTPGLKVSWQVTGIRQDPFANANPINVEEDKPPEEQGTYLHPKAHGMPETMGVSYRRDRALVHEPKDRKGDGT